MFKIPAIDVKQLLNFASKNAPTILTGLAVGGVVATAVMAAKATPPALEKLDEEKRRQELDYYAKFDMVKPDREWVCPEWPGMSKMDTFKTVAPCYIPAFLMGASTIACVVGANSINLRRQAAIAGLYTMAENSLKEYQAKVVETVGEKKEEKIREDIMKDRLEANPVGDNQVIITGKGDSLFYDCMTGRYFESDIETIRRIQNDLNHELMSSMWVSQNDLYCVLGLKSVKDGDDCGWNLDELIDFKFYPMITDDGRPCIVLDYQVTYRK